MYSSEYSRLIVYNPHSLDNTLYEFSKCQVCRVLLKIICSVFFILKVDHESVGKAALGIMVRRDRGSCAVRVWGQLPAGLQDYCPAPLSLL